MAKLKVIRAFFVLAVLSWGMLPAVAQEITGNFAGNDRVIGVRDATDGAVLSFDWKAEAKLVLLFGEPVVSVRFLWDNPNGILTIPILTDRGRDYNTIHFGQLSQDLQETVRLMDMRIRLTLSNGRSLLNVETDVGITGKPGEWSFNVPGSPDWDELFKMAGTDVYLGEQAARNSWSEGLTLVDAVLIDAEMNLYHLHEAYMRDYRPREAYRVQKSAWLRLIEALRRSYGIDAQNVTGGYTDAWFVAEGNGQLSSPEEWQAHKEALDAALGKLEALPDELRTGNNHAPYDQAVADSEALRRAAENAARTFSPEGVNPEDIEQGYTPDDGQSRLCLLALKVRCNNFEGLRNNGTLIDGISIIADAGEISGIEDCGQKGKTSLLRDYERRGGNISETEYNERLTQQDRALLMPLMDTHEANARARYPTCRVRLVSATLSNSLPIHEFHSAKQWYNKVIDAPR
ncbi:hypothetical protein ACEWPM_017215 [Roseovarius sp. S4756]|uniref:hypothetical protein n=1 Tax=Roseovarius maritimus TaxID=3342637 RepID=UPI00372A9B4E